MTIASDIFIFLASPSGFYFEPDFCSLLADSLLVNWFKGTIKKYSLAALITIGLISSLSLGTPRDAQNPKRLLLLEDHLYMKSF